MVSYVMSKHLTYGVSQNHMLLYHRFTVDTKLLLFGDVHFTCQAFDNHVCWYHVKHSRAILHVKLMF